MYASNATPLDKTQLIWQYHIVKKKKLDSINNNFRDNLHRKNVN